MRRSLPNWLMRDLVAGMALDVFKEQRRTAGRILLFRRGSGSGPRRSSNAVGDLGDFELGRDLFADALQFAVFFEGFDPVAQIVVGQGCAPPAAKAALNPLAYSAGVGFGQRKLHGDR